MENKLLQIQAELKAPKDLDNKFANYKYRSCESILEALKPLLIKQKCELTLSDEVVLVGNRVYVKATATLIDDPHKWIVTAFAREEEVKKGMDSSQITGAASSYARKYALNGLFLIDDTKDSDGTNDHEEKKAEHKPESKPVHESAKMAPNDHKITGVIVSHDPDGAGLFHKFKIADTVLTTSTKFPKILEDMKLYYEGKDNVEVRYTISLSKNPKYPDTCYIQAVRPIGDGEVPF